MMAWLLHRSTASTLQIAGATWYGTVSSKEADVEG